MKRPIVVIAALVVAVASFADETSAATNNCYARLVADVRMPVEPSVMVRMDGLSDRVSCLENKQAVSQDKQNGRLQKLETSLSRLDEVVDSRVDGRCEKKLGDLKQLADGFYEARYRELKAAHDRFMVYVDAFLVTLSIVVAIVGAFMTWYGVIRPIKTDRRIKKEWDEQKSNVSNLQQHAKNSVEEFNRSKAELYFHVAKTAFIQYKGFPNLELLVEIVKDLSRAIRANVEAVNAQGLKASISLLNVVMNKKVEDCDDGSLPMEIVEHRKSVCEVLRTWDWDVDDDDLEMVFDQSGIAKDHVSWTIANFRKIKTACGGVK